MAKKEDRAPLKGKSPRGRLLSINLSPGRGTKKKPVKDALLVAGEGLEGDGHRGSGHRQVSLLADESAAKMRALGAAVGFGDFAENLTTSGIDLSRFALGDRIRLGGDAVLEVTQIGKECHSGCEIARQVGTCVMPKEGIFCAVVRGGRIRVGDPVARAPKRRLRKTL